MANYPLILISELVTVEHGKYIIKVAIELQEKIITTAHAEGYTIEEAEDNARKRAMAFAHEWVNVNNIATVIPEKTVSIPPQTSEGAIVSPPQGESKPVEIKPPISPQDESKPLEVKPPIPPQGESKPLEITPPPVSENYDDFPLEIPFPQNGKEETLPLDIPTMEENLTLPLSLEIDETMDFSQIIDQTTIEMKRLGWTQDQGKKYLLETYGKKSRHLLSDQELIEFLQYLQSQP